MNSLEPIEGGVKSVVFNTVGLAANSKPHTTLINTRVNSEPG